MKNFSLRKMLHLLCGLIILTPVIAAGTWQPESQMALVEEGEDKPGYSISVETALVSVDVVVTDQDGNLITGLKNGNFRILDNGKPQVIRTFSPAEEPITIVMLVEYSARAYDYFAYKAVNWGTTFLDHLDAPDWVALVTYDMKPAVQVDFTHNRSNVQQALATLGYPSFQESNMFDAIIDTLDRLQNVKGKKSILLITTGANTFSKHTLDDIMKRLKQSDVTVFCVGVAESEYQTAEARGEISGSEHLAYIHAKNQLQNFAKLTGGHAWFPRFEGEITSIFRSVALLLRNQYRLGFSPPNLTYDGKYHKLKVEIVGPDGKPFKVTDEKGERHKIVVYAREGYVAPDRPVRNK